MKSSNYLRLGVNIDHVATVRNARGGEHPDPVTAAFMVQEAGADGITAHLREDRRHIKDNDIIRLGKEISLPLNLEMAATQEMLKIACKIRPHACCIVPEKRQELTTEGGLDVVSQRKYLKDYIAELKNAGIRVSLFIDPVENQLEASGEVGAQIVEIHTGRYCHNNGQPREKELQRIIKAAKMTTEFGLECHGGHGLNYENVGQIAAIPEMRELNIGHFLIGEAIFVGLKKSIRQMRLIMDRARK